MYGSVCAEALCVRLQIHDRTERRTHSRNRHQKLHRTPTGSSEVLTASEITSPDPFWAQAEAATALERSPQLSLN